MKPQYTNQYMKLGLKIAYFRKTRGLTQEELAEKVDKNASYIGAVEAMNVKRAISLDTLFDIARVLEVSPYKFLDFDED